MTKSFKQMTKSGEVKRADAMRIRHRDIHIEPGFNLRLKGAALEEHIESIKDHILSGGRLPDMEVRPREEGGAWLVDGHCRHEGYARAIKVNPALLDEDGELWLGVVPFLGNDAERVARVITSAKGKGLEQMEMVEGIKRLVAFDWSVERICQHVNIKADQVRNLITLGSANSDVQKMVRDGTIAATEAVRVVKQHGEKAGAVIKTAAKAAEAEGKTKVTASVLNADKKKAKLQAVLQLEEDATMFRFLLEHGEFSIGVMGAAEVVFAVEKVKGVKDLRSAIKQRMVEQMEAEQAAEPPPQPGAKGKSRRKIPL